MFWGKIEHSFEQRLIIITCLSGFIATFISTVLNILIGLDAPVIVISLSAAVLYGVFFVLSRNGSARRLLPWLITLTSIVLINLNWFYNYGSRGPIFYIFLAFFAFVILTWERRYLLVFSAIILVDIAVLLYFDFYHIDLLGNYSNETARVVDAYWGIFMGLSIIGAYIYSAKRNYIKQYTLARRSDDLKTAFLANMSHEVRTPLNAIVGFANILSDPDLTDEERTQFVRIIEENSENLTQLFEDTIDIAKIEAAQLTVHYEFVSVESVFREAKRLVLYEMEISGKNHLTFDFELSEWDLTMSIDRGRLLQLLRHLLSNAVKFTSEGHITLGVTRKGKELVFFVKDTGCGVQQEHLEQIFERFVKVSTDPGELFRGTGIGLYLCQRLVQLMKGEIWVESEYGVGSAFYFSFPEN